jgi:membrane protein required for beta-lactamase induction
MFTLAFGFSFIFERGFSESFKYAGVICVVAWCICFVALIEDYLKLLKDDKRNLYKDNPDAVTMAKKLATIRESNRTQKQTVIQSILLPVYAMWLIAQYVWCPLRQPVKLAQVIFIALAMTCFKVQSLGRYTTAISAMIGFATGIYCNNSELVALFVGGLSGEVLLHLSRFMLRFLPDPETPLPSFS